MSVQSDITEEVRAKAALVLEKERAENILSGTNVGTWESNLLTGEQHWNDRWSAMMGFTRAEVVPSMAEFLRQRLHAADLQRLHRALVDCITGRSDSMSCEARVQRKDGSWMWILNRAKVMSRGTDGRAEWVGGILADITELKQVELSLRDMEAFLDRAGRIAGVGAWQMDLHTRELVFSPQTREIHGMEPGAPLTEELALSFYPEPDRTRVRDALRKAEQGGTSWDLVVQFQNTRGQLLWVRIFCEVWFDDNGPVRLMGAFQDVTKDRLAQIDAESASAKRSEEQRRLQSILEGTHVGTWEWNVQTGESIYNEQYVGMLGYTLQELEPMGYRTWVQLVHPDDLAAAAELMQKHLRGELANYEIEVRMLHKLGHWIWVLAKGRLAQRMADGSPLWVYGTHMDITERKRATEALAQTSAMLQNVLDSATAVGVMTMDLDHTLRVFNRGAENLLGYGAHELVASHSTEVFFDHAELGALAETLALVRGYEPTPHDVFAHVVQTRDEQEWTLVRKDASRFKARLIFSPMRDVQGALQGHLAMVYDISKQKEYEHSLREAMRLAEQSSVAKSQFLANMSHEIRTPMNAILGMLQLMRSTPLNPQQHDYTDKAVGAARSLLGLLNDILDFSKVEAGKMQLNPEPFALDELLADLSVILSSNLGDKAVDLVFDVDPAIPPMLVGDAMRLKQILINLGGNAVKFTERGEVALRLSLLASTPERVKLGVAVVDSGIGIAPENQSRIFDAFTQAEANTTRRFGGTGLGLVISTRLIRLMGGELQLTSALGQGSTFSFTLELPIAEFAPQAAPAPGAALARVRVLLVDDNPHALGSASVMLRAVGWDVWEAASGAQALECLQQRLQEQATPLDAVFVDAEMSGMDGWDTLRNVRRLYAGATAPKLILLSRQSADALAKRSDREHDLRDGLLVRPVTGSLFERALQQAQSGTQALTQRQSSPQRLRGMRILLVEDNLINQQVAQELLEVLGAKVTLALNGALGVAAVQQTQPAFHAVLMDLQMPVMDGLTATRLLRADPRYAGLPIIAMTANAMLSDREECLAVGMNDHVGKPFDLQQLVQTLIRHTHWAERTELLAPPGANMPVAAAEAWPAGLAIEQALARMGGERALLQRAIAAFVKDAQLLPQRLEHGLQQGALDLVKRELHSAKGLAATVGATDLSGLAALAEQHVMASGGREDCLESVAQFTQHLRLQLPALEAVAIRLQGAPGAQPPAPKQVRMTEAECARWHRLLAALQASDMVAMELHAELRQHADPSSDGAPDATLEALDHAMAELDFEAAAAVCEQLVRQFDPLDRKTLT